MKKGTVIKILKYILLFVVYALFLFYTLLLAHRWTVDLIYDFFSYLINPEIAELIAIPVLYLLIFLINLIFIKYILINMVVKKYFKLPILIAIIIGLLVSFFIITFVLSLFGPQLTCCAMPENY